MSERRFRRMPPLNSTAPYPSHGSHRPTLERIVRAKCRAGDYVLELGAGNQSTPLLVSLADELDLSLVTIEPEPAWQPRRDARARRHLVRPTISILAGDASHYRVCFVDNAPPEMRAGYIRMLRPRVDWFVVHDTERASAKSYDWGDVFAPRHWRSVDHDECPWFGIRTTILEVGERERLEEAPGTERHHTSPNRAFARSFNGGK
jgi:hypothetical protein